MICLKSEKITFSCHLVTFTRRVMPWITSIIWYYSYEHSPNFLQSCKIFDIIGNWGSIDVVPKVEDGKIVELMETEKQEENAEEDSDCVVMENSSFYEWALAPYLTSVSRRSTDVRGTGVVSNVVGKHVNLMK